MGMEIPARNPFCPVNGLFLKVQRSEVLMIGELLVGFICVISAFFAFLLLSFFSVRRVNRIKERGLKTLREIKRGLTRNERTP